MAKRIPLTRGKSAVVDDADYARLSAHKWAALPSGKTTYAVRRKPGGGLIYMHQAVKRTSKLVDHADRNGLDNRRANLRPATQSQNQRGVRHNRSRKAGKSGK